MSEATSPLEDFLQRIPKIELHCHLLGTIRKETMKDLARKNGARTTDAEIDAFYIRGDKPVGVLHIFRELENHIIQAPADLRRIAYEYLEDASRQEVRHAEFFWNPTGTLVATDISYSELQKAILVGMKEAEHDFGITSLLIPSIDREASASAGLEMVELICAHHHSAVIGIGLDYNEVNNPPEKFSDAYSLAKKAGLKTTAHAGEFGMPWKNVETAMDVLGVDRLDHAYTVLENPTLVSRCIEQGILITVVPTNSFYLRTLSAESWAKEHPIRQMARAGLKIHPNTDDPAFHLVNPIKCQRMMVEAFGCSIDDLKSFMLNGLEGSWLDKTTKSNFSRQWSEEFDEQRKKYF